MKRVLGQALSVVATVLVGSALMPACAENDRSIFIRGALAPPSNRQGGVCEYAADPGQPFLFEGVLDAAVRDHYVAVLLIGNQLMARGDTSAARSESNRARIEGAIVRVTDPDGATLGEFTSLASGFVDPQSGTPGYASVAVTAIDAPTVAAVSGGLAPGQSRLVVANIKAFGKSLGGVDLESGEFEFPIRVCNGCLITFSPDPAAPEIRCPPAAPGEGEGSFPCRPGQDEATPCQLCLDRPACQ